jgi:hypothetical protein
MRSNVEDTIRVPFPCSYLYYQTAGFGVKHCKSACLLHLSQLTPITGLVTDLTGLVCSQKHLADTQGLT